MDSRDIRRDPRIGTGKSTGRLRVTALCRSAAVDEPTGQMWLAGRGVYWRLGWPSLSHCNNKTDSRDRLSVCISRSGMMD